MDRAAPGAHTPGGGFDKYVNIPGIAGIVLGYLSPAEQLEAGRIGLTFYQALRWALPPMVRRVLGAGHPLDDFMAMLRPRVAPVTGRPALGEPLYEYDPDDEVGPARAQLAWSLAAHLCDIAGIRFTGASILLPTARHQVRPICGPRWLLQVSHRGPFELLLSGRPGKCDRSLSLDDCIRYVYDGDRHGVIHGYAVPVGGADSALLARLGGRFAQALPARVVLVKTEEGLFLVVLQVPPGGALIECTGVVQIREATPEPEESPEGAPPWRRRRQFVAAALSRRALVGDKQKCVGICAYALALSVMRSVYSGPLRCRAYAYTCLPAKSKGPDTLYTLVCQEPQLVETPGGASPNPRPVLDGGADPFGAAVEFDDGGLPECKSPTSQQPEAAAVDVFVRICEALAHNFAPRH